MIHYSDARGRAFEIRRPGTLFVELAQADDAPTIYVLGSLESGFAPVSPGGDDFMVQFTYPRGGLSADPCSLYSLNEYGLSEAELIHVARGLAVKGEPRPGRTYGALDVCPGLPGALPPGPDAMSAAREVALEFSRAWLGGDRATVGELADLAWYRGSYDVCCRGGDVSAGQSAPAAGDGMVAASCGDEVASRSWRVTIDDGSSSASLDTELYLIRREDGWKVWASY